MEERENSSDTIEENSVQEPSMYRVIMLNDNYTTREFVVQVLIDIFQKDVSEAEKIMMQIHTGGRGVVGIYVYDIAVTRTKLVFERARQEEFPLKCIVEKA